MTDLVKIGALWVGADKKGNPQLTGKMGDARLLVLKNNFKERDNQPDYVVYVTKNERRDNGEEQRPLEQEEMPF